ncbi:MAG: ankyrin repeat domain-containing protein, partial [Nitrospirales bacterium]|nr:ankyrin repeat domain-containing protein [Nitrospirales bacterium]
MVPLLLMFAGPGFTNEEVPKTGLNEALFEAVGRNDAPMVRQLLKQGASIHAQNGKGQTELLLAVDRNHIESAKLLIEAGADVNAQDRQLDSPLLLAGARGYFEILKLTLEAKPNFLIYNR